DDDGDDGREYEEDDVDHDDIELNEDEEIKLEEQDDEKDLEDIGLDEDEEIKLEEQSDEEQLEDIGLEEDALEKPAEDAEEQSDKSDGDKDKSEKNPFVSKVLKPIASVGLAISTLGAAVEVSNYNAQQAAENINQTEIVQEYEAPAHPEGSIEAQIDAQLDDFLNGKTDGGITITIPADSVPADYKVDDGQNIEVTMSEPDSISTDAPVDPYAARIEFLENYLDAMGEWADGRVKDQEEQNRINLQKYMDETEPDPLVGDPPEGFEGYGYRPSEDDKEDGNDTGKK
ncbi:MAG: hypothetical protein IKC87_03860, partial [Clostridia bacterium]|nr:hypothetical protein [Clostridia bacterium]